MKKIYSLFAALAFSAAVFGQTSLANWTPSATTTPGGSDNFGVNPFTPTTSAANITVGGLTRGSGVGTTGGSGAANAWGGNDMQTADLNAAIADQDFFSFSITPDAGYKASITQIGAHNVRRSNSGPTSGQWQYQIGSGAFQNIGSTITWGSTTSNTGNEQAAIDLSSIAALQNIPSGTTVTFRVVIWGGSSATGTLYLMNAHNNATTKSFEVLGTVAPESTAGIVDFGKATSKLVKNTIVNNELTFGSDAKDVKVYNMLGQVVKAASVKAGETLEVSDLKGGAYIVTGTVNNEAVSTKVIKN